MANIQTFQNQIIHGEAAATLQSIEAESVDLCITDPPYLCGYKDREGRSLANDHRTDGAASVLPVFKEIYRVLKPDSYCLSFYGWGAIADFARGWEAAGFGIAGHIVWPKAYASRKSGAMNRQHECAYLLIKGRPRRPGPALPDVQDWTYTGNRSHPTEKAVEIIKPLIESFSRPGDLVLDPFLGSGTTAVAAALTGRAYLGIELEERYCQLARRRLAGVARFCENRQSSIVGAYSSWDSQTANAA